jgi:hypothetical protein
MINLYQVPRTGQYLLLSVSGGYIHAVYNVPANDTWELDLDEISSPRLECMTLPRRMPIGDVLAYRVAENLRLPLRTFHPELFL